MIDLNYDDRTILCDIMDKYGSDKGSVNHNYTRFYDDIFKNINKEKLKIFELGIGSNNNQINSNMTIMGDDYKPGASLFGWSEYFINSDIFGADIDTSILFRTDRIKTFYCDQTNSHIIQQMWDNKYLDFYFDIIIDDGLHYFDSNINFFENSYQKLNPDGIFIIEDINFSEIYKWINKFEEYKIRFPQFNFELFKIKCDFNPYNDNNLIKITFKNCQKYNLSIGEKIFYFDRNIDIRSIDYDNIDLIKIDDIYEYDIFTENNILFITDNIKKIECVFHLEDINLKNKFRNFRDNILHFFDTYSVFSIDGVNIRWDLFNEHFIEYYSQVVFYIDNRILQSKNFLKNKIQIVTKEITKTIVVAHYNENLDWFLNLDVDCDKKIYSKTSLDYYQVPKNSGLDAPCYMKYIIDNYNNLTDKTLFLHGHSDSIHQDYPSSYICKNVNWNLSDYFSVNNRRLYQTLNKDFHYNKGNSIITDSAGAYDIWLKSNWYIFNNELEFPKELKFYQGSQFVVDKKLILQYPIEFWQNLYDWIQNVDYDSFISSRIFEYTWHYILTKNPIEKEFDNINLFG